MKKIAFSLVVLVLLPFSSGCFREKEITEVQRDIVTKQENSNRPLFETGTVVVEKIEGQSIILDVEIADTSEEKAYGLMNKDILGESEGMWFEFDSMEYRTFWMKDTLIPLDIIFIDSDNKVVSITEDAYPCETERCEHYSSDKRVQYVLEVNGGFSKKNDLKEGDTVYLR